MGWFFGPPRSKFGKWIERRGLTQTDIAEMSGVTVQTVSRLANGTTQSPTRLTARKIINALRNFDPTVDARDFWDM